MRVLEMLEDNWIFVVAIICLVVAACLLAATISVARRAKKASGAAAPAKSKAKTLGKHVRSQSRAALPQTPFSALLVINPQTRSVESAGGDIEGITGLSPEALMMDAHALDYCLELEERHALEDAFDAWDRKAPLQLNATLQNDQTKQTARCTLSVAPEPSTGLWFMEIRDTTEEQALVEGLRRQAAEAEEGERAKLRFLSDMSHEIRTPMNGIMGTLALAQIHADDAAKTRDYLEQADDLTQYLLSIINNVLDISKIENGKMELEERAFSLADVLERMRGLFAESTKTKGINYTVKGDSDEAPYVVGDELRLVQVITNLVSNAQKFTPAGGSIDVELMNVQATDERMHFVIRVRDTGKGMDKEFLKTIFDPFSQESTSTSRQFGGTGLGMAISDQIIRLMGGYIVVESELGKGTTFEIYLGLPVASEAQIAEYEAEKGSAEGIATVPDNEKLFRIKDSRILMAEDNMLNAGIAEEMLGELGAAIVDHAADGQIAVDMFQNAAPGTYDIILMDIQMPNMDGREATRTIRALSHPDALTIPIIALSADAYVEDKRASRKAGMNGHISKPVVYETLEDQICVELATPTAEAA